MQKLTFKEVEAKILETKSIIPKLNSFYNGEITGEELHKEILSKITLPEQMPEEFLEFISQINKPLFFGSWTKHKISSTSFFAAFTDIDFIYDQNFTPAQIQILENII